LENNPDVSHELVGLKVRGGRGDKAFFTRASMSEN
jgi:hypothetical protein